MDVLRELVMTLGLDVDTASFAAGQLAAEAVKKAFEGVVDVLKEIPKAYKEMLNSTAEAGHEADELSQRTGIAADTLQEFGYAAGFSGVSMDEMAIALGHLAKTGVKDLQEGLLSLADKFADMDDGGTKTALAIEKFGRAGSRLIPFLNRGRDGIAELATEARELGVVMDATLLHNSVEYAENSKKLDVALTGLKYTIAGPLLAGATKTAQMFVRWIQVLRQWHGVIRENMGYLKTALVAVSSLLLGSAMRAMSAWIAAQLTAAGAAGTFGAASLLAGAKAAGAAVLAMAPWALLAGLIILLADDIETFFTGGDSLLGRYGEKWTHFLDAWTKPDPNGWWVLNDIKAAIHALADLQGTWEEFKKTFFGSGGVGGTATLNPDGSPTGHALGEGKGGFFNYLSDSVFGAPAGPAASGGTANAFNAHITVNANAGGDGTDLGTAIGNALRPALDNWWTQKTADAMAAGR
jgi:hypothetical protein